MAIDPVQYIDNGQQHFQRYAYANNNPYKYTDPTGEVGVLTAVTRVVGLAVTLKGLYDGLFNEDADKLNESLDKAVENEPDGAAGLMKEGTQSFKDINDIQKELLGEALDSGESLAGAGYNSMAGNGPTSLSDLTGAGIGEAVNRTLDLIDKKQKENNLEAAANDDSRNSGSDNDRHNSDTENDD